jgi:hypothetical protein
MVCILTATSYHVTMSSRKHKNFLDDSLISTQGNSISIEDSNFLNDQIIKNLP